MVDYQLTGGEYYLFLTQIYHLISEQMHRDTFNGTFELFLNLKASAHV